MKKLPPKNTYSDIVLNALLNGERLSTYDAFERWNIMRLPNCISDLRRKYHIKIEDESKNSNTNKKIRWKEYWMNEDEIKRVKGLKDGNV